MKTIMLVCAAGMSTSIMVQKMKEAARDKKIEVDIFAVSTAEADSILNQKEIDVLMLGPQVRFMKKQFENKLKDKNVPVVAIDMKYYGMMDGKAVLEQAFQSIQNK